MSALISLLRRRGSARTLVLILLLVLAGGTALTLATLRPQSEPVDRAAYDQLMASRVRDWNDLLYWFSDQQEQMARIIPPGLEELVQPGTPDLLVLDSEALHKELASSKPAWLNSVSVWELELQENINGEITILDGAGNLIHTFPAPPEYQIPYEALFRQSLNAYTPELNRYKLRSRVSLLPLEYVEPYLYVHAEIEAYARQHAEPEMQMMMGGTEDELAISGMQRVTNGLRLTVSYPASFSGQVWSVYQFDTATCITTNASGGSGGGTPPPPDGTNGVPCTNCVSCALDPTNSFNGLESAWALCFNNLILTGETSTSWTDTLPMGSDTNGNPVTRFYGVGSNEDPDNDELHSGFELFVSHTDEEDDDSDGDGLSDGWEVANGLNPNDGAGANGSNGDLDADGLSNAEEQEAGTDPRVADPVHEVGPDEAVFEYRSAEVVRSKPGFVNFVTDTNGVDRCYLEFESYGEVSSPYSMGDQGTWSCSRSVDPVSGKTPMPGDTGVYEAERAGGEWWNSTLNIDYQSTGTWWLACLHEDGQGSIPESFSWAGSCHSDDPLDSWYANFYDNFFYSIDTYWWPDAAVTIQSTYRAGYDLGYSREDFLANEYTTDMLTNHAWQTLATAPMLSNLVWGTGWVHQTSRSINYSNYEQIVQAIFTNTAQTTAYYRVTSNEARCDLARTGYRLRIPTQSGVVSRVRVVEWFAAEEATSTMNQMTMMSESSSPAVARTCRVAVVLGNGGTQVVESSYFEIDPPTNKGVVYVGILSVDLDSDLDNDGDIDDDDEPLEQQGIGEIIRVNDTDDLSGTEDDLQYMELSIQPDDIGKVWITYDTSKVKLWEDEVMTTHIPSGGESSPSWDLEGGATLPTKLYVEGLATTASNASIQITLHWKSGSTEITNAILTTVTGELGHYAYIAAIPDYIDEYRGVGAPDYKLFEDKLDAPGGPAGTTHNFVAMLTNDVNMTVHDARGASHWYYGHILSAKPSAVVIVNASYFEETWPEGIAKGICVNGGAKVANSRVLIDAEPDEYGVGGDWHYSSRGWVGQKASNDEWDYSVPSGGVPLEPTISGSLRSAVGGLLPFLTPSGGNMVPGSAFGYNDAASNMIGWSDNGVLFFATTDDASTTFDPDINLSGFVDLFADSGASVVYEMDGSASIAICHRDRLGSNLQKYGTAGNRHLGIVYNNPFLYRQRVSNYMIINWK